MPEADDDFREGLLYLIEEGNLLPIVGQSVQPSISRAASLGIVARQDTVRLAGNGGSSCGRSYRERSVSAAVVRRLAGKSKETRSVVQRNDGP
ncbi:MAG TPA: hypothetical protein EYQ63_25590 [Fuerstia sp.]|nr:hypothetical protein [Fuerstiella sp.]